MHADPAIAQHVSDMESVIEPSAPLSAGEAFADRSWVVFVGE